MLDLSVRDFAGLISRLTPTGDAWPTEPDSIQQQVFAALAGTFKRLNDRANALVVNAFPKTTVELLAEWEASLGLPDPCTGLLPTIAQRQAAVVAKLIARGGQSVPYFISVAAALGYTITITEFAPARAGLLRAGDPLYGPAWAHAWQVNAPQITVGHFAAGASYAGEPLAWWGNRQLVCTFNRIKPAHTPLLYLFGTEMISSGGTGVITLGTPITVSDGTPLVFSDGTLAYFTI